MEDSNQQKVQYMKKTLTSDYYYLDLQIVFEKEIMDFTDFLFKAILLSGIKGLIGQVGLAYELDLLSFDNQTQRGIIRIHKSTLTSIWSSLSLIQTYDEKTCKIQIHKVSPFLQSLTNGSRKDFVVEMNH